MKKKKRNRTVTIISRESDKPSRDISMLAEELGKRGIDVNIMCRLLRKDKTIKALSYIGELARQIRAIPRSSVVVVDTYIIPISLLPHTSATKVIQMWHALSAIKKFGWQTVGKEEGSSLKTARLMRMHNGYDYVVACSDVTAEHFCEAFKVGSDKIVKLGLPRIDFIKQITREKSKDIKKQIYCAYPKLEDKEKKTILYAPTFRREASVDIRSLAENLDLNRYNLVVKLHSLDVLSTSDDIPEGAINDRVFDSYEWLAVADIIISDYSSLVVEACLAGKPLYIYAYDEDEYREKVGLNIDFDVEPIAPYVFRNSRDLTNALDAGYDMKLLERFRDRYIDIDTTNCTAALADFIESLI